MKSLYKRLKTNAQRRIIVSSLMNTLHKIVILYFFGLGLILWICPISNHVKFEKATSLQNLKIVSNRILLNLGNDYQQCLFSFDFVRILIFAYKQDTWLPVLLYHKIVANVLKHLRRVCRKSFFKVYLEFNFSELQFVISISGTY